MVSERKRIEQLFSYFLHSKHKKWSKRSKKKASRHVISVTFWTFGCLLLNLQSKRLLRAHRNNLNSKSIVRCEIESCERESRMIIFLVINSTFFVVDDVDDVNVAEFMQSIQSSVKSYAIIYGCQWQTSNHAWHFMRRSNLHLIKFSCFFIMFTRLRSALWLLIWFVIMIARSREMSIDSWQLSHKSYALWLVPIRLFC